MSLIYGCSDDQQAGKPVEQKQTQSAPTQVPVTPPAAKPAQTTTRGSDITFQVKEFDFGTIWEIFWSSGN